MKKYNQAPLPFQGQKRRFLPEFRKQLKNFPPDAIYADLFGGSGILSHTVKDVYPEAQVIWNDYDNYSRRLQTIPKTNKLLSDFRMILKDCPSEKRITKQCREQVLNRIQHEQGFVDYITLSSSLLFSMNYVTNFEGLCTSSLYNKVRQTEFSCIGT